LLYTSEDLENAQDLLKRFQDDVLDRHVVSNAALWEARQVKESMVHPQTESVIPLPFRMAAFVPVNIPICAGMLLSAPTMVNTIFWQWANQSYNAGFNYANRNASSEQGSEDIMSTKYSVLDIALDENGCIRGLWGSNCSILLECGGSGQICHAQ